jgi:hypothetical protein
MKASDIMLDLGKPIAYYPGLAKRWGPGSAAFFSQIFYWTGKQSDKSGWIYKTQEEIEDETGLGDEEQRTARKRLKIAGILEEREARLEHRIYYRINLDGLNAIFPETGKPGSAEPPLPSSLIGTTESTPENTESLSAKPPIEPLKEKELKPKEYTPQQKMVGALAKVMNGNASLMGTRLGRFASAMIKVGATSEKVLEMYDRHGWWYKYYWKGHDKGQYPNEADIRNTWDHWDIPEKPSDGPTMADLREQGYS